MKRFNLFGDNFRDVFKHADTLRIEFQQWGDEVGVTFKISGGITPDLNDDDNNVAQISDDPAELASRLMSQFLAAKSREGRQ